MSSLAAPVAADPSADVIVIGNNCTDETAAPEVERSRARLFDVPLHLFRRALAGLVLWVRWLLTGNAARAFAAETRLWFFSGFLMEPCACVPRR